MHSKINAAMAKLAEVDKPLAEQGLEKVLTQLDKVPGVWRCARLAGQHSARTTHTFEITPAHPLTACPPPDPTAELKGAIRNSGGGYVNHALFW